MPPFYNSTLQRRITPFFANDRAELALWLLMVKHMVSACFQADHVTEAFTRLRGYLSTLRTQGVTLLAARESVVGQSFHSEFACTDTTLPLAAHGRVRGERILALSGGFTLKCTA